MQFTYNPLNSSTGEIRLIQWLPTESDNDDGEEIRCQLMHVSLDDEGLKYDALSYTWGDPQPSQKISMGGILVDVGPNLYGALKQLHHANRNLWVDSLCINQQDLRERETQVSLMRSIYKKADTVIMWLGEENDDSKIAMPFLKTFREALHLRSGEKVSQIMLNEEFNLCWAAVGKLFQQPYWSRVWIVQEVLLAQRPVVYWGTGVVDWNFFRFLLININEKDLRFMSTAAQEVLLLPTADLARTIARLCNQRFGGRPMSLIDCFVIGHQRSTTDPRDHIYGVLSLVDDAGIVPDYSISAEKLYRNVVQHTIEQYENLDILSACNVENAMAVQFLTVSLHHIDPIIHKLTMQGTIRSSFRRSKSSPFLGPRLESLAR